MNATKSLAAALLAFGLLGLSPVATSAVAATASPCGAAQRVLQRGNFADAETLYTGLASAKQPAATMRRTKLALVFTLEASSLEVISRALAHSSPAKMWTAIENCVLTAILLLL